MVIYHSKRTPTRIDERRRLPDALRFTSDTTRTNPMFFEERPFSHYVRSLVVIFSAATYRNVSLSHQRYDVTHYSGRARDSIAGSAGPIPPPTIITGGKKNCVIIII